MCFDANPNQVVLTKIVSVDHGFVVTTLVVLAHVRLKSPLQVQFVVY